MNWLKLKRNLLSRNSVSNKSVLFLFLVFTFRIQNDTLNGKIDANEFEKNLNQLRDYIKK